MIKVHQSIIDPKDGDCFPACLASVLEIGLEDVPHFLRLYGRLHMLSEARKWMAKYYGMTLVTVELIEPKKAMIIRPINYGTIILVSGKSKTFPDEYHIVVGRIINDANDYEMIHDPNPSGQGIDGDPLYYYFFTAVDPGRMLTDSRLQERSFEQAVKIEGIPLPHDDLCSTCHHYHTPEWNMICCVITCQCDRKTFVSAAAVKPTELSITIDDLPEPDFSLIGKNPIPDNAQIEAMMDQEYEANPYR